MLLPIVLRITSSPSRRPCAVVCFAALLLALICASSLSAQTSTPFPQPTELQQGPPLTNQEYVALLYQLPKHPEERDRLIDQIRKRGIAFQLTPGLLEPDCDEEWQRHAAASHSGRSKSPANQSGARGAAFTC